MYFDFQKDRLALVIVDVQTLFTSPDGPFESDGYRPMISAINLLSATARNASIPIVFSRYAFLPDSSDAGLLSAHPVVKSGKFSTDSSWTNLDDHLDIDPSDMMLSRNRPGAFHGDVLAEKLQEIGRDQIILAGLSVNNAISTTARQAFARDIAPLIVKECVGIAPFEPSNEKYFEILDTWTAMVMSLNDAIAVITQ